MTFQTIVINLCFNDIKHKFVNSQSAWTFVGGGREPIFLGKIHICPEMCTLFQELIGIMFPLEPTHGPMDFRLKQITKTIL